MGMENVFKDDLLSGEKIIWSGQPERKVIFSSSDTYMVPFSLLWGGFVFFWEAIVLLSPAPAFFSLWGIPFVVIGLYFIFGRFIYKNIRKKNTYYAVTDKRVLTLTKLWSKYVQAAYINTIPTINKSIRADGIGTLKFGNPNILASWYGNTGLEFFGAFYGPDVPTFYDIANVQEAYKIVNDLRNKQV